LIAVGVWITTQDIFQLDEFAPYRKASVIHGIHCTGSAALGDTGFELKQGEKVSARGFNSKLGNATTAAVEDFDKHYQTIGDMRTVAEWSLYPTVNATTNGIYLAIYLTM